MRVRLDLVLLFVALPLVASADPRSLVLVPHPLEFDPRPELNAVSDKLKAAWVEAVREAGDVVTPTRKEVEAAVSESGRHDCRTANDCLAALATKGAGLYAAHAVLELTSAGSFVVTARVVRDDGRLMATFSAQAPRVDPKRKPLATQAKALFLEVVNGLAIARLPSFKEASTSPSEVTPPVEVRPKEVAATPVLPPPPPPPEPTPAGGRSLGAIALLGAGGLVAAGGAVLVVVAQTQARELMVDANGFLPVADDAAIAQAKSANTVHLLGLGALGLGAATAAVGAVLLVLGHDAPAVSIAPSASGFVVGWSGRWL